MPIFSNPAVMDNMMVMADRFFVWRGSNAMLLIEARTFVEHGVSLFWVSFQSFQEFSFIEPMAKLGRKG